MDYQKLADLLFPKEQPDLAYYEELYPPRKLKQGAVVTRIGPSPTGFVHLGNLYNAIIGERLAHQSGGVFFLRIEDTDKKREVPGAVEEIIKAMDFFSIHFDEGATIDGDNGAYGPYRQRQRKDIYHAAARYLVEQGYAYPCFATEEELTQMREEQNARKLNPGYYGSYAIWRDRPLEDIIAKLDDHQEYVLRYRSRGDEQATIELHDAIRGTLELSENYQDFVLLKSDGIPTYHFAHVVDDHFMRTTHVVRGEEWLATAPIHAQLFDTFGWERPVYCHTAQLMKMDGETKRKLSKRHDPELALSYYLAAGYLPEAVWEYLLTVLNSNFEEWRLANPTAPLDQFAFSTEKMSSSGALFDLDKFNDISKEVLVHMNADKVYAGLLAWAQSYDREFAALLERDPEYAKRIISVGKSGDRPRKDLVNWQQACQFLSFYYDERFHQEEPYPANIDEPMRAEILTRYLATLDFANDQEAWFAKIRVICEELNFALQPKKYKKNPELYRGSIVDLSNTIRVALTGRQNSPDLWEISQIIGEARCRARIEAAR